VQIVQRQSAVNLYSPPDLRFATRQGDVKNELFLQVPAEALAHSREHNYATLAVQNNFCVVIKDFGAALHAIQIS
jgi:hypothetical protein